MLLHKINRLPRTTKRMILFSIDMLLIAFSLPIAFALRFGMIVTDDPFHGNWVLFPATLLLGALTIRALRLNHIKIHAVENNTVLRLAISAGFLTICAMAISFALSLSAPRTVPLIFGAVFFMSSVVVHFLGRYTLDRARERQQKRVPVAIYGAGNTGEQLVAALTQNGDNRPVCFIDDNRQLHGMVTAGLKVHPPNDLRRLIKKQGIKRLLLAMPSASYYRLQEIQEALSFLPIDVIELPNMSDQVSSRSNELSLQSKRFEDPASNAALRVRDPGVLESIAGKSVMIAGAGGQIGAELARQIVRFEPAKLVLFDRSESALQKVLRDLTSLSQKTGVEIDIQAKTGSIGAVARVRHLIKNQSVQIVFNAAHYSDPQLAENNLYDLASTNVLGPMSLAEVAIEEGVEQLVLLSSERVLSPIHLVDQTQMLAEKLVMGMTAKSAATKINFLRFGRTTGRVGGIISVLEHQIRSHNSVTLPGSEMTRFLVTTARAVDLILRALPHAAVLHGKPAHLSKGTPRRVMDFVDKVVQMTGKGPRNERNPFGIEIKFSGLRPGEHLHETCPIQDRCTPLQAQPDLLLAPETGLSVVEHGLLMQRFTSAIVQHDEVALRNLLQMAKTDSTEEALQSA